MWHCQWSCLSFGFEQRIEDLIQGFGNGVIFFSSQRIEELQKEVRAREVDVTQRDKVITELRLRLPASEERDRIIDRATSTMSIPLRTAASDNYDSQQAYKVAQSTVHSLQVNLTRFPITDPQKFRKKGIWASAGH